MRLGRLRKTTCALAFEAPSAGELEATATTRCLLSLVFVLRDVDVRNCDLLALFDGLGRDEVKLCSAAAEGRLGVRVAGVRELGKWSAE